MCFFKTNNIFIWIFKQLVLRNSKICPSHLYPTAKCPSPASWVPHNTIGAHGAVWLLPTGESYLLQKAASPVFLQTFICPIQNLPAKYGQLWSHATCHFSTVISWVLAGNGGHQGREKQRIIWRGINHCPAFIWRVFTAVWLPPYSGSWVLTWHTRNVNLGPTLENCCTASTAPSRQESKAIFFNQTYMIEKLSHLLLWWYGMWALLITFLKNLLYKPIFLQMMDGYSVGYKTSVFRPDHIGSSEVSVVTRESRVTLPGPLSAEVGCSHHMKRRLSEGLRRSHNYREGPY